MKQDYVTFEQAMALKAAGFDYPVDLWAVKYTDDFTYDEDPSDPRSHRTGEIRFFSPYVGDKDGVRIPTLSLASKWLREAKKWFVEPSVGALVGVEVFFDYSIVDFSSLDMNVRHLGGFNKFPTYEAALSAGISESLKLLGYA